MTDPNPLKQAAEEAKARKLAEVQREQEAEARQTSERERMIREAVAPSFEVIGGPFTVAEGSETFDEALFARGLLVLQPPSVHDELQRLFDESPVVDPPSAEFYIIRPREVIRTLDELTNMLDADGLQVATVKDLIALDWKPSSEQDVLYAMGYSREDDLTTAVRGTGTSGGQWIDYDYPEHGWSPQTHLLIRLGRRAQERLRSGTRIIP